MSLPVNTPAALGQAVRNARKQIGLTQPQLALAAGVGRRFVVDLEAGKATLAASGLAITSASDLTDAAQKIVAAVKAA